MALADAIAAALAVGAAGGLIRYRHSLPKLTRWLPVALPYAWMVIFFLIPFLIVLRMSFSTSELAQPPYSPTFNTVGEVITKLPELTTDNFARIATRDDPPRNAWSYNVYVDSYLSSVWIALVSTAFTLAIGYPIAYGMARAPSRWRPTLLMLVILPFWTSFLIRVYAWIGILSQEGFLNQFLGLFGLGPLTIMQTNTAVYIGIVYSYLPFMILPLYSALEKMDDTLLEAAADLGCPPMQAFWKITFPLSLPGVIAGCFLVFIPVVGEFVIPDLLGGSDTLMIGRTLWEEFYANRDWPAASAVAIVLLVILVIPIMIFQNQQGRGGGAHG
jgi:putrescine transport system permease protein